MFHFFLKHSTIETFEQLYLHVIWLPGPYNSVFAYHPAYKRPFSVSRRDIFEGHTSFLFSSFPKRTPQICSVRLHLILL